MFLVADLIALTGANGQATGPHLHISLVREYDSNGKAVYEDLADYNKELRELVEDSAKESNV